MRPILALVLVTGVLASCSEAPAPPIVVSSELPPPQLNGDSWRFHALPGSYVSTPVEVPQIVGLRSTAEVYNDGGVQRTDTLDDSGFVVTHTYDGNGTVREVLVEDPKGRMGMSIELDSNGTVREISSMKIVHTSETMKGLGHSGWRMSLDQRGRVDKTQSGVVNSYYQTVLPVSWAPKPVPPGRR